LCKTPFWERHQYEHHVTGCATAHAEEIHQMRPSVKAPAFDGPWDKELGAWLEVHRDEVIEGRKRM
jgi:hypothetical protein